MVSINDYATFGDGFGISSSSDLNELNKALNTGGYAQAGGVNAQVNGAALQVESLENSLKVLTYNEQQVKFWKKISKQPAYSTVEEYNQLTSYGSDSDGFVPEGILPDDEDSNYKRQASFVKFLGTTRSVTHPMTLVRSAHGDVVALENRNGILWLMKKLENALFWGNSKLAPNGAEGVQFDGLDVLIPKENTIDLKGEDLKDIDINHGAQLILENYGTVTDLFLPYPVLSDFSQQYFPKERVIMPTQGYGYQAGLVVNKFQTPAGAVQFEPDIFLQKTKSISNTSIGKNKIPSVPKSITVSSVDNGKGDFGKTGAGTYIYNVTAVNRHGESVPCSTTANIAITSNDFQKSVEITITNSEVMSIPADYFKVYRSEKDGSNLYHILDIPAQSVEANGVTTGYDENYRLPNTYTAFMGEFTPQVITFKQLAPIMKMDLAVLSPAQRWMILIYGVPQLFAPKKWIKFINIKSN